MGRRDQYRAELRTLDRERWTAFLHEHSGLPGPRGNIELAQALAEEADGGYLDELIATDDEYLVFCGVVGLGRLLADATDTVSTDTASADTAPTDTAPADTRSTRAALVERLHGHAADARWRVREAVAMAMQRLGDVDLPRLLAVVTAWADDPHPLVQRAALAAVCEPRLLTTTPAAGMAVDLCARVTSTLAARPAAERRDPDVRTLRQGLGYCWSVAVAADPERGLPRFLALADHDDPDVAWIVRENRRKKRLARLL
ncbi:MAG: HEAT repeat domain-containing protein [Actinomycetales bacterium]|nr:HEAT repeat domain-containing protein [Actinomycetales bacterium]